MDSRDVRAKLQRGLDGVISFHLDAEMEDEDDMSTRQPLLWDAVVGRLPREEGAEKRQRKREDGSGELCALAELYDRGNYIALV